ncbi:hypothetical protein DSECCO2_655230 [anaerobic digester metagenome]
MVHVVVYGKRHRRIEAVHGTGRSENEMLDIVMAAVFQDIVVADDIGVDVVVGVRQAVPDTGLCGQVDDMREAAGIEQGVDGRAIGHFGLGEGKRRFLAENLQPVLLERHGIVRAQVVEAGNGKAHGQETATQVEADKSGRAGDKDVHGSFGWRLHARICEAVVAHAAGSRVAVLSRVLHAGFGFCGESRVQGCGVRDRVLAVQPAVAWNMKKSPDKIKWNG